MTGAPWEVRRDPSHPGIEPTCNECVGVERLIHTPCWCMLGVAVAPVINACGPKFAIAGVSETD